MNTARPPRRDPDVVAIRHASETREGVGELTWGELRAEVARIRAGLVRLGVGKGDRVAAYLPNIPEAIAACLATASLAAVWSSAAPEFGARAVVDRFAQIEPRVLLAVDGYTYRGKRIERDDAAREIAAGIGVPPERLVRLGSVDGTGWGEQFERGDRDEAELSFERVPFDHPLWILYSSGTTGLPKAIVHGHGGMLVEQLKSGLLQLDLQADDRFLWFTTTGWMMWNVVIGALLTEASVVLWDGDPGGDRLWDVVDAAGVTTLGVGAAFLDACRKQGVVPRGGGRTLEALRAVGSTGSPLSAEGFAWVYDELGADTHLFSTSGGTDVCTSFVGGVPVRPVYRGELQARLLGCAVEAWDEAGNAVVGEVGELVVTRPMPSMPVGFWGDDDGSRYREAYFEHYPGVWRHGDWLEITDRGTAIISGRSDATINRGGVRMGTAEVYRAVLLVDEVVDALVVDVPRAGEEAWMPLFVVLREGAELDDDLRRAVARRIREDCSPRHVPDDLFVISAVPRTLSGKALELPVKKILTGTPPDEAASRESLANPEALDEIVRVARAAG